MKDRRIHIPVFLAAVIWCSVLHAEPQKNPAVLDRDELYYTYAGLMSAEGMTVIHRRGWIDGRDGSEKSSGWYAGGGLLLDIYVRNVCGEFSWQYSLDSTPDKKASFGHSVYTGTAKYIFPMNTVLDLTAGGGVYFEGPPAAKEHGGGGCELTGGAVLSNQKYELKFPLDLRVRAGYWGRNARSTRFGYGLSFGVTKKLGRS